MDQMRLIQLMSPEFQINNRMLPRKVTAHAEKAGPLAKISVN